jgi:hypothetical protein
MRVFESKLANAKLALATMFVVLVISIILNFVFVIGLVNVPKHLKVYQENCNGTTTITDPQAVSKVRLQWFVSHVWVGLNSWANNGDTDSIKGFKAVANEITPRFKQNYVEVLKKLKETGLYDNYILSTVALANDAETNVEKVSGGWLVRVTYISTFYFNPYGTSKNYREDVSTANVSSTRIEQNIVFKVVQYPNKWGLALDEIADSKAVVETQKKGDRK